MSDSPTPPDGPAATMYGADAASQALGIRIVSAGDGRATAEMEVRSDMVNGLDVCHGGLIFTLADTAMAFASNSEDVVALASQASIDWLHPAHQGRVLTATAVRLLRQGRTSIHDVTVVDDEGTTIALFRGRTRTVGSRPTA